jgi:3-hydroxyacyl-[acyl-carrier-protein] dehydratase
MKLKDDFFKVLSVDKYPDKIEYTIQFNAAHSIYHDHFPGNPITPGVCIIQTIKELTSENTGCELFLRKVSKVRYFKVINPVDDTRINISLNIIPAKEENNYSVTARVFSGEIVFAQVLLEFRVQK